VTHYEVKITSRLTKNIESTAIFCCNILNQYFFQLQLVKILCKLIITWVNYEKNKRGPFLWNTVYYFKAKLCDVFQYNFSHWCTEFWPSCIGYICSKTKESRQKNCKRQNNWSSTLSWRRSLSDAKLGRFDSAVAETVARWRRHSNFIEAMREHISITAKYYRKTQIFW